MCLLKQLFCQDHSIQKVRNQSFSEEMQSGKGPCLYQERIRILVQVNFYSSILDSSKCKALDYWENSEILIPLFILYLLRDHPCARGDNTEIILIPKDLGLYDEICTLRKLTI